MWKSFNVSVLEKRSNSLFCFKSFGISCHHAEQYLLQNVKKSGKAEKLGNLWNWFLQLEVEVPVGVIFSLSWYTYIITAVCFVSLWLRPVPLHMETTCGF